ncbi:ATP-dependent Clp protease proteolytic subunit-related protein 1- chloroplastic [Striga hermonthica]|uniref:ATP-dependent Clp protease proteolytic subunit n=1 Tax=Striga hermonthica TaxID=68872 RepID=A0A9N7R5E3_STRHE|nr:ATP-dependent Clp protease proteolytic subunit-related protein 1- chloroplastic [Striga hermonthica]
MASSSSLLLSPFSSAIATENQCQLGCNSSASTFIHNPKLLSAAKPRRSYSRRCGFRSPVARKSLDHIPKQFRGENLKDGLMENYKNVPEFLYGLTPPQMDMFMKKHSPINQLSANVNEETLTAAHSYLNGAGMSRLSGSMNPSMSASMSITMPAMLPEDDDDDNDAPDLPSLILDSRVVYLGMPLGPSVVELIVAQLMYLDYMSGTEPIHLYINSTGTLNGNMDIVGSEYGAYAIADSIVSCEAKVYTLNIGQALGQAAMFLALGNKGCRAVLPATTTQLYLPKDPRASGVATDMWVKGKEIDVLTDIYLGFLSYGIGKSKEELKNDMKQRRSYTSQEAVDYGIVDRIVYTMKKPKPGELLAKPKAFGQSAYGAGVSNA